MADPTFDYHIFLLRCWHEAVRVSGEVSAPRFSLEDPNTGERHGFTRAADLVDFLERALAHGETITTITPLKRQPSPEGGER